MAVAANDDRKTIDRTLALSNTGSVGDACDAVGLKLRPGF